MTTRTFCSYHETIIHGRVNLSQSNIEQPDPETVSSVRFSFLFHKFLFSGDQFLTFWVTLEPLLNFCKLDTLHVSLKRWCLFIRLLEKIKVNINPCFIVADEEHLFFLHLFRQYDFLVSYVLLLLNQEKYLAVLNYFF